MQTIFHVLIHKTSILILLASWLALTVSPVSPNSAQGTPAQASRVQPQSLLKVSRASSPAIGNRGAFLQVAGSSLSSPASPETNWGDWVINGPVYALAVMGKTLYGGGEFATTPDCPSGCNNIAQWDGQHSTPLGTGMNGRVTALAVSGSTLYAGGLFTTAGTCTSGCKGIAKWDGHTWSALGGGVDKLPSVSAIAVSGNNVYVGGAFTSAGSCSKSAGCEFIAKWDGSNWSALGGGVDGWVRAISISGSNVYVGGSFTNAGTFGTPGYCTTNDGCFHIARWDGNSWSPLGTGMSGDGDVFAIASSGSTVYAGGHFTNAGACSTSDGCNHIAKWDGSSWSALGSGTNNDVLALLTVGNSVLIAGGLFDTAGDCTDGCAAIARWYSNTWSDIGGGLAYGVYSIVLFDGTLYAAVATGVSSYPLFPYKTYLPSIVR